MNWKKVKLQDVADLEMGQAPPGSASNFNGKGTIFVKAGEFGELTPIIREWTTKPLKYAKVNDVLICVVGATSGKLNLGIDCAIGRSVAAIRPKPDILQKTLYYQLLPKVAELRAASTGSAQGVISKEMLNRIEISLPSLDKQHQLVNRIESFISKVDIGVQELNTAKQKLELYRQSVLNAAIQGKLILQDPNDEPSSVLLNKIQTENEKLIQTKKNNKEKPVLPITVDETPFELPIGWSLSKGLDIFEYVTSGSRGWGEYRGNEGALFLGMGNLSHSSLKIDLTKFDRVKIPKNSEGTRTRLQFGDLLISITADVGMVGFFDLNEETYVNQHVALVRCHKDINSKFIAYFIASPIGKKILQKKQRGATKVGLGLDDIRNGYYPIPPIKEQDRIVKKIETVISEIEAINENIESNFNKSQHLKQSILKKAFNGEL